MHDDVVSLPLSKGYTTIIDAVDLPSVQGHGLHARLHNGKPYAYIYVPNLRRSMGLHRFLLGAPKGQMVDHANGDGLNNRRGNLRVADRRQNGANRRKDPTRHRSKYKGVSWHGQVPSKPWSARCRSGPKNHYLGLFASEEEAARAYDRAAIQHFGEFAHLNFEKEHYK